MDFEKQHKPAQPKVLPKEPSSSPPDLENEPEMIDDTPPTPVDMSNIELDSLAGLENLDSQKVEPDTDDLIENLKDLPKEELEKEILRLKREMGDM